MVNNLEAVLTKWICRMGQVENSWVLLVDLQTRLREQEGQFSLENS